MLLLLVKDRRTEEKQTTTETCPRCAEDTRHTRWFQRRLGFTVHIAEQTAGRNWDPPLQSQCPQANCGLTALGMATGPRRRRLCANQRRGTVTGSGRMIKRVAAKQTELLSILWILSSVISDERKSSRSRYCTEGRDHMHYAFSTPSATAIARLSSSHSFSTMLSVLLQMTHNFFDDTQHTSSTPSMTRTILSVLL